MTGSSDVVLYEKRNRIAYVTLNRPEAMNALNSAVGARLYEIWSDFRDDDDLLVAILTGAGGRAFSAGADLKEVSSRQAEGKSQFEARGPGSRFIPDLNVWKPIISAIDGYCVAGGLELAMQHHAGVWLASHDANGSDRRCAADDADGQPDHIGQCAAHWTNPGGASGS